MRLAHRLLREPLVHFAALGALLFALQARFAPAAPGRRIEVDASMLRGLRQDHLRRTGALPDRAEETALVERYVEDEVMVREALALGLDRGDVIIRRRLVQKMEFLAEALDAPRAPSDAELERFVAAHRERYAVAPRVVLTQVFVGADRHGSEADADAAAIRARLVAGADPRAEGDPFPRGSSFGPASERELAGIFGAPFAAAAMQLEPDAWSTPLRSSYGLHLVRVSARSPGEMPPLSAIRAAVARDWSDEQRELRRRAAIDELRRRYDVRVAQEGR